MNQTPSRPISQTAPKQDLPRVTLPAGAAARFPWLSVVIALLYGASPIDLIPDVILLFGQMDDAVVLGIAAILVGRYYWKRRKDANHG